MDPNILIPAVIAAVAAVAVAVISRSAPTEVVQTEARHVDDEKDRLIQTLADALLHCLREHGGPT